MTEKFKQNSRASSDVAIKAMDYGTMDQSIFIIPKIPMRDISFAGF